MFDFHAAIEKSKSDLAKHLGKDILLNGVNMRVPFITTEGGASMGGYRRQPLNEKVILLTEQQAQSVTKEMTVQAGSQNFITTQDPIPRADGWLEVTLREVFE
ncbi:hypothetical protein [Thiomicrorhabdus sp.]|uniref:hypothetical protein n=1 Tax=Thiomicrorhabdus sp. TaxID=2039724 RepID=UPI0029C8CE7E|nr:hypothetical protein [Thiomicrorhabdus sp.]